MFKHSDDAGSGRGVTIEIERTTFERLQRYAVPLVDSIDSVLNRLLDTRGQGGRKSTAPVVKRKAERRIDPRALPDLTHTKVLEAVIDGVPMRKPSWNPALRALLGCAMERVGRDFGKLQEACRGKVNVVEGRKTDDGYHHVPGLGISAQSLGATAACDALVTVAQALGIAVDVGFVWRDREGTAFPGEGARLQIAGRGDGEVGEKAPDPGPRVEPQAEAADEAGRVAPAGQAVNGVDPTVVDRRRRRRGTRLEQLLDLLRRAGGTSIDEIRAALPMTDGKMMQPHTVRGHFAHLRADGYKIGVRYRGDSRKGYFYLISEPAPKPASWADTNEAIP